MLDAQVLVLELFRLVCRHIKDARQPASQHHRARARPGHRRDRRHRVRDAGAQRREIRAESLENRAHDALFFLDQDKEQMLRRELLMLALFRQTAGTVDRLARAQSEFVELHGHRVAFRVPSDPRTRLGPRKVLGYIHLGNW